MSAVLVDGIVVGTRSQGEVVELNRGKVGEERVSCWADAVWVEASDVVR